METCGSIKISQRKVAELVPYARNARTHSDAQVEQIAASIREFGWTNPILVDGAGGIIAGHGRLLAAKAIGLAKVPCIVLGHLSDAQRRALVLADNQLALNGGWDEDLLAAELRTLIGEGFDVGLTGFGGDVLAELLADKAAGLTDPDDVPDAPADPVTQIGDIWLLGRHRVACGDSADVGSVSRLVAGEHADLLFTSPPYAQQRDYGVAREKLSDWTALMQSVFSAVPMKAEAQLLVNLGLVHREGEWIPYWDVWIEWMRDAGWRRFGWYVWDQGFGLPGDWNGRLAPSFEFIFHFNRETLRANKTKEKHPENVKGRGAGASTMRHKDGTLKKFTNPGASAQPTKIPDSVIRVMRQVGRVSKGLDHPAVFPVALAEEVLGAYSKSGDIIFEPFCGSGTQVIAAEKMGRHCYGSEIDPAYVDVSVIRWQEFTGKAATLEATGQSFDEVRAERARKAA